MEDREFFNSGDVSVSLTRFVAFGKTYAMSGVTSVRAVEIKPTFGGPIAFGIVGLLMFLAGLSGTMLTLIIGAALMIAAYFVAKSRKPEYHVQLSVSSGEVQALRSPDRDFIYGVVKALNDCIIARG